MNENSNMSGDTVTIGNQQGYAGYTYPDGTYYYTIPYVYPYIYPQYPYPTQQPVCPGCGRCNYCGRPKV